MLGTLGQLGILDNSDRMKELSILGQSGTSRYLKTSDNYAIVTNADTIYSTTSKGDQLKWKQGNYWLKADTHGYEGLAEEIASKFIRCIIDNNVLYKAITIKNKESGKEYKGCLSRNMLYDEEQFISLNKLLNTAGKDINLLSKEKGIEEIIATILQIIKETYNYNMLNYLTKVLYIDQIIVNADRHTNNLGLIRGRSGRFREAPIFDNGLSLLSGINYWNNVCLQEKIERISFKPFGIRQIEALRKMNPEFRLKVDIEKYNRLKSRYRNSLYGENLVKKCFSIIDDRLSKWSGILWREKK